MAPTALFKKKKRRTCTNTHFQNQRRTDPPESAECGSSGGRPKANAMFQKRGARSVPKRFFANCVRQCAKKVGNRNRAPSEQAPNCFGLHRTHLLIKLQTWSWHSGCRRSTVTKPSQNDATQSQDAHGWKRQMPLSDNRRPYWTWTLAKHELNPGSPHETQATMG